MSAPPDRRCLHVRSAARAGRACAAAAVGWSNLIARVRARALAWDAGGRLYFYRLYCAAIVGVLVWVFIRHAGAYRKVRRVLVATMALILPVYWAVPESPPRFALPGVIDIVAK
jgi:PAP2 superfamily